MKGKTVRSLSVLSTDKVVSCLSVYRDSIQYLPVAARDSILRKLLRKSAVRGVNVNHHLQFLIHTSLKQINLSSVAINNDTLELLQKCPALRDINLRSDPSHNITNEGLKNLFKSTTNLLALDVSFCKEFDDGVAEAVALSCLNLQELQANRSNISDKGLIVLTEKIKNLKCLSLSETAVTGTGIGNVCRSGSCSNLKELRLDRCAEVNDQVLSDVVQNCPLLEILTFYNCPIKDATLVFEDITLNCPNMKQIFWTITW